MEIADGLPLLALATGRNRVTARARRGHRLARYADGWRLAICLAGFLVLAAAAVGRAEMNFQYVPVDASFFAYERDVGDVDGDGQNDIVGIQEGSTSIEVFRAPSWGRSTLITFSGTFRYPRADDFKVGDLDGDGDLDLVTRLGNAPSSDSAGIAVWCENLGGTSGFAQHLIGNSTEYVKDIVVADFDRDDRLDVAMRMDHETQIWLQDGGGMWSEVRLEHPAHEGLEAGDLDGDGDPDLILNGFWFSTPNNPAEARTAANYTRRDIDPAWFTQSGDWTANSCKVVVGDMDGDGRQDVAFSQSERAGFAVAWYRSEAPQADGPWTKHAVTVVDFCHNLQAADWDLDGDVDLLVGGMVQSQHRGLKLMLNDGDGIAWTEFVIQSDGSYSAETGDIDNDGDLDIVGIRNWNSAPTYFYRNNAGGGPSLDFWAYAQVGTAHVRTFGLCFPDADADGDLDIASGPFVYLNPGAPLTGAWNRFALPDAVHAFATLDVDGDGFSDLLAQKDNGAAGRIDLFWIEATTLDGTTWVSRNRIGDVPRSEHVEGFQGYRVAALGIGDGRALAVSSSQGVFVFSVPATDAAEVLWPRSLVAVNDSDENVAAADIDGDGRTDFAFTTGASKQVRWARNPGDGSTPWPALTIGSFPEADWIDRCEAADLNGDGRVDILATEENGGTQPDALACWWEQPAGGPNSPAWVRHTLTTQSTMNSLDVGDVDRDGDTDVVLAEHRGAERIAVWANNGLGSFTEHRVGAGRESHLGGRLADLDGDGDLDLVSIAYDDFTKVHLWRNDSPQGTASVARPVITPPGRSFDAPVTVSLSCSTPGATIWYTVDGSEPTDQAPSLVYAGPITVPTSLTLKARGFLDGRLPSTLATASFIGPKVDTPRISPPGATFNASQSVTLTVTTSGARIHWTRDGSDPAETDPIFTETIVLDESALIKARAFRDGHLPSDLATASFTLFKLGAVAHWRFDERFGTLAADSSGANHPGTVVGATPAPGRYGQALSFDGTIHHVNGGVWDVAGEGLSMCAWIKLAPDFSDNDARILAKAVGSQEQDHWWMLSTTTANGQRRLRVRIKAGGTTSTLIASSGDLTLDTWLHAAATYDGSALRLFLDGIEVGQSAKSGALDPGPNVPVWIGANPPDGYAPFHGLIDDVRIYNIGLDASAVAAVRNEVPVTPMPRVIRFEPSPTTGWALVATGEAGHFLHLERSTDFLPEGWQVIASQPMDSAATATFTDPEQLPRAFYRVRLE